MQAKAILQFGHSVDAWSLAAKLVYNKPGDSIVVDLEAGSGLAVLNGFKSNLAQVSLATRGDHVSRLARYICRCHVVQGTA